MWPYHPPLLARPVPRYTSYPTAVEFNAAVGGGDQLSALKALPQGARVSLYAHIPFCKDICWYCGCNTHRANRMARVQSYLEALEAEIDWLARQAAGRVELGRLSLGGGSPNAIDPLSFVRLVGQILTLFGSESPEISIELDPRTLEREWVALLGKVRASRASLGVQTLEPHVMQAIGRVQPREMIEDAVSMLRDQGVTSLNFDLMYGLPGQSMDDLMRTLDAALEMSPDRIALFGYAHVPSVIPRQRQIDGSALPDADARFEQAARGYEKLLAAGMQPIGFDHFAKPSDSLAIAKRKGRLRRNFQGFTDDLSDTLLGVGATAISSFPDLIVQNEKNLGRYGMRVRGGQAPAALGVRRSPEDRERGLVIEDLLCGRAADLSGLPDDDQSEGLLQPFLDAGLCQLRDDRLLILPDGLPYSRAIAACFDSYRPTTAGLFSSAV